VEVVTQQSGSLIKTGIGSKLGWQNLRKHIMNESTFTLSPKAERDARRLFQIVLNRLVVVLEKKHFSDFQEEQVRQLSLEFKEAFTKWGFVG